MSDVAMPNQLLTPHLCQSTPLVGLLLQQKVQHFAIKDFRARLMLFGDISQSEMLLGHFMPSIRVQ
jgi:hypothetical protein